MTAMLIRRHELDAPVPDKIDGTLLDVVTPMEGIEWGEPAGLYTSLNCLTTDAVTTMCPSGRGTKTFGGPVLVDGFRFPVYTGFTCKGPGLDWDAIKVQLATVQANKESTAVESALMLERFTGTLGGAAATDLTPAGGAVSPEVGLAILEGDSSVNYAGKPIIHAPRSIASLLLGRLGPLEFRGSVIYTPLNTPFVAGAGYEQAIGPNGSPAAAGEKWMYATGAIQIQRSPALMKDLVVAYASNDFSLLTERVYVLSVDCYLSAVRVTLT